MWSLVCADSVGWRACFHSISKLNFMVFLLIHDFLCSIIVLLAELPQPHTIYCLSWRSLISYLSDKYRIQTRNKVMTWLSDSNKTRTFHFPLISKCCRALWTMIFNIVQCSYHLRPFSKQVQSIVCTDHYVIIQIVAVYEALSNTAN